MQKNLFGNPNAIHFFGQQAQTALDTARQSIAHYIGGTADGVVCTASATEANNLVLRGAVKKFKATSGGTVLPHIILSAIEHDSIYETARDMEREGLVRISLIPVTSDGVVDVTALEKMVDAATVIVSVLWANNETGALQPLEAIGRLVRAQQEKNGTMFPFFHTDAAQAFGYMPVDTMNGLIHAITLSSHKIYGPKGVGVLYVQHLRERIAPILTGGGQEYGVRSGTQNVAAIMGAVRACELAISVRNKESIRITALSKQLEDGIRAIVPEARVWAADALRVPHIINVCLPHYPGMDVALDMRGVAVSSGAACAARHIKPSRVLEVMGASPEEIACSIRMSIGMYTRKKDISQALECMATLVHA